MSRGIVTRRSVLVGGVGALATAIGGAAALIENGTLPGRARVDRALGLEGTNGTIPARRPGPRADGAFDSRLRQATTGWSISYPPGSAEGAHLPVMISLHGKGATHVSAFEALGLDRFLAETVANGTRPFAIATVDGGDGYWHRRRDGSDSGAMVTEELLPLLATRGLDTTKLALTGWSMGGYGALLLASAADHPPVRVVSTLSAALWTRFADVAPGAFDDAADFASHDVFGSRARLTGVPVRMDCGIDDPFHHANQTYASGLPAKPAGGWEPGEHTDGYWRRLIPAQLAFVGEHLTA